MSPARQRPKHIGSRRRQASISAGHTWFVRITKFILPIAAVVIVGFVVARLSQDPQQLQVAQMPSTDKTTPGQIALVAPRYEGFDAQNRPYTVSAKSANRVMGDEQVVALEEPRGDIALEDGSWLSAQSAKGLFNNTAGKLYLSGGVSLFHDTGYEMHLKDVTVDIKTRAAESTFPVDAQGPVGRIEASNLRITDEGQMVVFGGPAKLTLWLSAPKEKKPG